VFGLSRDPEVTHKIMSAIKSKNTKPEILLRKELWRRGLRFRTNYKAVPGTPDIVFTRAKIAVFCDGDFWHGHNWVLRGYGSFEEEISHYAPYWSKKIQANVERDQRVNETLRQEGWLVLRLWENDIKRELQKCAAQVERAYRSIMRPLQIDGDIY
jgi:DNA mismatch endonuclease (patch repair protein)